MKVLLTGGSGAIGEFVRKELSDSGHETAVLDVREPADETATFHQGSVTNEELVTDLVPKFDSVVHMASLLPPACRENPLRAIRVNTEGAVTVFDAASTTDTRVIYISSKAVIGPGGITGSHTHPTYEPLSEDIVPRPTTTYGSTKFAVEKILEHYRREEQLDGAAFRFASTYGPGKGSQHGNRALVPQMIEQAAHGERVSVSGGDQRNDFIYYGDIARGIRFAIEHEERLQRRVYHLGSGQTVSLHDFEAALEAQTPGEIQVSGGLNFREQTHPTYCQMDISRVKSELGYVPKYPPSEAVSDYLSRLNAGD